MFYLIKTLLNKLKLQCCVELWIFIAAEFEWKAQRPESLEQVIDLNSISGTRRNPHLISLFDIELTLTKRRTPRLSTPETQPWQINELRLTDDAFLPKRYTIRLEKGNFLAPADNISESKNEFMSRYALRLVFDKSPYPPRHEWKQPEEGPDGLKMWEWKEFVGEELPRLEKRSKLRLWRSLWRFKT